MPSPDPDRLVVAETLVVTVISELTAAEPGPALGRPPVPDTEPGPAERALAATYERYAAELAEIEALRSRQHGA
jgi:hypothetical protein